MQAEMIAGQARINALQGCLLRHACSPKRATSTTCKSWHMEVYSLRRLPRLPSEVPFLRNQQNMIHVAQPATMRLAVCTQRPPSRALWCQTRRQMKNMHRLQYMIFSAEPTLRLACHTQEYQRPAVSTEACLSSHGRLCRGRGVIQSPLDQIAHHHHPLHWRWT